MDCKAHQSQLALLIGRDLNDPAAEQRLAQHMAGCSCCQKYYKNLSHALESLQELAGQVPAAAEVRLWPRVQRAMQQPSSTGRGFRRQGWVTGLAVMAASMLIVFAAANPYIAPLTRGTWVAGLMPGRDLFPNNTPGAGDPDSDSGPIRPVQDSPRRGAAPQAGRLQWVGEPLHDPQPFYLSDGHWLYLTNPMDVTPSPLVHEDSEFDYR